MKKKICNKCKKEKNIEEFGTYWHNKNQAYYRKATCKECRKPEYQQDKYKPRNNNKENLKEKECRTCHKIKNTSEFYWNNINKKFNRDCKECQLFKLREKDRLYKEEHKEEIEQRKKERELERQRNKQLRIEEKLKLTHKICCKCKKDKDIKNFRWRKKGHRYDSYCKECREIISKLWDKTHPGNRKKIDDKYRKNHPEKVKQMRQSWLNKPGVKERLNKEYNKNFKYKYDNNPQFKLNHIISSQIRHALKGNKNGQSWEKLVGYTVKELYKHLEKQFQLGMTWKNHGTSGWHIDHIIPKSSFKYKTPNDEQFKKCWALENLKPLWATENLSKWNHREEQYGNK